MDKHNALVEYIFKNHNLDFIVDVDNKTVQLKDYDEVNQNLFNEIAELKKHIFTMFINGEDIAINRIKSKLETSREDLAEADFGLSIDVVNENFEGIIEPEQILEINNLKIKYIDELLSVINNFSFETAQPLKQKLKTNLTVKEIAYLFRALHDEGIIESRQKTDLFNFIAENFSSKQKDEISSNSIKNAFDTPDYNAVDFWQEKFTHFMQKAKKDKENLLR